MFILSTVVGSLDRPLTFESFEKIDLLSESPPESRREKHADNIFRCQASQLAETSMGQYFEVRQAMHFHNVIKTALRTQADASERLASVGILLDKLNQEILKPKTEASNTVLKNWIESYPGSETFKVGKDGAEIYDLDEVYGYVEQDVHRFFYRLLQETLLPQNLWMVGSGYNKRDLNIQSVGVKLGENTWARIGVFPRHWHLHIYKSPAVKNGSQPKEHFPLQALSLRVWSPEDLEVVDGSGKVKLKVKRPEELDIIPYCEWLAGESRREQQLSQKILKNL